MSHARSRGWCYTLNNHTEEDEAQVVLLSEAASYSIVGRETGESGTPHLQGYAYFANKKSFKQVKALLPRAHWEPQKGTTDQAADYCKKDGDYAESGTPPASKKRKGELGREYWQEQLDLAKAGRVQECDPKLQITHGGNLDRIAAKYAPLPADLEEISNFWYWGSTGTGKSFKARSENPGFYLKKATKWWDGYIGQECVILEDFDKRHEYLGHELKIWADRYSFPAEVKNSSIVIRPKKIIVTSNWSPDQIWSSEPETLDPIRRRFNVVHFDKL